MAYTPTQGIFVNGHVADADDILNEFNSISTAFNEAAASTTTIVATTLSDAKQYTDTKLGAFVVDGGTF